eukprot:TRINITY_DN63385_c0_g1_i1.p1 TRINITY_DN63385_c0_g1~~TRINITY_DN63385_c0_g1_i1.p1  ORF type:complete len:424 (+),score=93.78 TRINITY_DN63385_c0_g1_i1:30-1301(+)
MAEKAAAEGTGEDAAEDGKAAAVPAALDVAKADSVLKPIQALPGIVAHTVGNLVGGATLGAGWAIGKADAKLGKTKLASDSEAFKMGFRAWLYANGIWPTVLCEGGPYGNDFVPLPSDASARCQMLRSTPIVISNHVSYLDTVILPLVLEVPKLVAMAEVKTWPLFGQLCRDMDMIWVDRKDPDSRTAAKEAISEHAQKWERGERPLLVWPEGTTSNGQGIKEFKSGAFAPGKAVRPVVIKYTGDWDPANVNFREDVSPPGAKETSGGAPSDLASSDKVDGESSPSCASKYGDTEWVQQFMGHMVHSCTVLVCKTYQPTKAEQADPELFKSNVHKLMQERLRELNEFVERRKPAKDAKSRTGSFSDSVEKATDELIGNMGRLFDKAGRKFSETSEQLQASVPWLPKFFPEQRSSSEKAGAVPK